MLALALYILVFIALSGLLAMVDAAVLSVSRAEVEELVQQGKWGAVPLRALKHRMARAVVIVVIVTNTINVLGPILVGQKAVEVYGSTVIGVITAVLTLGTIIFSEIIPKSLGAHYAPLISRVSAPVILVLIYALYPLVVALDRLTSLFQSGERPIGTEAQIRSLVAIGRRREYIESDEATLIHRAFVLNDRQATDIMTPLERTVAVRAGETVKEAAAVVVGHPYSRYPVFGETADDVRGIVLTRDLLEALAEGRDAEPVTGIARQAFLVGARTRSDALLVLFRDKRIHQAVVQQQGKTLGIVTLEDVLEELVGEIEDERDVAVEPSAGT
jgi:putative hemolysin